jgi:putative FmdB family regulatory protein
MPFYEYNCPDCENQFSKLRSMSHRDSPTSCPNCEGAQSTRRISLPLAFSRGDDGEMRVIGNSGSPCGSCVATSCAGCM